MKQYQKPSLVAGANLKRLIKESKYGTQEEFADAFGADVRTVNRWINNGIKNVDQIQEIAEFLNVDVSSILPF